MGGINTFYTPGSVQTDTSGGPGSGGSDMSSFFFQEMARRRAKQDAAEAEAKQAKLGMRAGNAGTRTITRTAEEMPGYVSPHQRQMQELQLGAARQAIRNENAKPSDFGRMQANNIGDWGNYVNPADVPVALQDKIKGGFYSFGNAAGIAPLYPGMVKHGYNGSGASGGDNSLEAEEMAGQRASVQNTNLRPRPPLPPQQGGR